MPGWLRAFLLGSLWGTIMWWGFGFDPDSPGTTITLLFSYLFTWVLVSLGVWLLIRRFY